MMMMVFVIRQDSFLEERLADKLAI